MKITTLLATAAFATVTLGGAASAATLYATDIVWTNNGTVGSSNDRDNPLNALGAPDGKFMALGLGGFADFTFGETFTGPGASYEVTFGKREGYLETAEVFVGANGSFTSIGAIDNASSAGFVFSFSGVFDTLRLLDTTPGSSPSTDGYDVDAVSVTSYSGPNPSPAPVPLPAPALMLGAGLLGLGAVRKMGKKA
ncbi:hypothetical protein [Meridianimarinicoccus aquatilis]|uniref:VPLPA-CTERM sorting domain-containing protein n=1 Tax=Meridianimarinicoccus aquatilis TaxID=2552766 RepID=A0A4V3BBR0_9RHOB|nr:hypothetical protein [Fluviibacterium aquatile]QIE41780.1 hypothetical protein G5B39_07310 [Rhodobacteraceae bacterium SC52]TDL88049.1 hypothetical protein E2L05_09105 [Fluviibacterium aquatile]